jgi:two-component system, LytTR family, sensor kinase
MRTRRQRQDLAFGSPAGHAVYEVLALANAAAPPLRGGLTPAAATAAAPVLRQLLGAPAIAITDSARLLAWDGEGRHHRVDAVGLGGTVLAGADSLITDVRCTVLDCPLRSVVAVPLVVDECVVGTLQVYLPQHDLAVVRAAGEVARWVATQVELGELDRARAVASSAQLLALRAQISPHFIFNALNTIASFVRTDPDRARDLLVEFADFARYSFADAGQFTTLAEELKAINIYVNLERARFGDRLQVSLRIAPEVLSVRVPFLMLQPLVENALQHGLRRLDRPGRLSIVALDEGPEAVISVEDDGVGADPDVVGEHLAGHGEGVHVGLVNVDERMRAVFGPEYGLVVETAVGAGMKVTLRVPKFRGAVRGAVRGGS